MEVIANTQVPWAVILHKWHFLNHVVPDAFELKFSSAAGFSCFNYLYHSWPEKPLKHFLAAWWPFQGTLSSWQHRSHDVYASGAVVSSIMVHTDTGDRNSEKRNVIPSVTSVGRSLLLVASIPIIPLSQPYAVSFFLELRYVGGGGSLISRENTLTFAQHPKIMVNFPCFSLLLKYFCAACMWHKQ